MSILNYKQCATSGSNTGTGDCPFDPKSIAGGFIVPANFELTDAQLASKDTAMAALLAAVNNDNPALRAYPLPEVVGVTDNSEDPVFETLGYGVPALVREGNYNWLFRFQRGAFCALKALMKFNGTGRKVILFDVEGSLIATKSGTSAKGIPLYYFHAYKFKLNDGSANTVYSYGMAFNPVHINQNIAFIQLDYAQLLEITGIQNVVLSLVAPRAAGVFKVKTTTGCAGLDLYDLYATELGVAANFRVTEAGKVITITSVVKDDNAKAFTVTMDTADPDYNAAGPFVVNLAPISVLSAAGVVGFEGIPLTVV